VFYVIAVLLWTTAIALAAPVEIAVWPAAVIAVVGALLIWPMLRSIDDARPETALAAFKRNAVIGAAVLLAFMLEPIWRTVRPTLGI
jgi:4-hydroxybenzoate polyprenyltransferase